MSKIAGKRLVYFPNITFTLCRGLNLQPKFAVFRVPLHVNKFDVRDYLQHVYNLKVVSVKSRIYQGKLFRNQLGQVKRPQSEKRVIVEMEEPFVYPNAPNDLKDWQEGELLPDGSNVKTLSRYPKVLEQVDMKRVNEELSKLQDKQILESQQKIARLLKKKY
ncbi:54S ribosomal protein L23, mitochondrial [Schizosaccharomyces pombe]|uniref:Large ribosomal subunit protein uL23m n=1 Tax=Schizosaccharomyces pombe (strain 972 / ATCC 24843) TaxID=284812 RepID=MRP20_SCHPO|nr:putative mitochondrial ribosomal protein subunit L23 [Schizosaccharomyces pombe]Q09727.1 RecName: Full=Large ribosomal subunit protein uL23m; AltName: Full=54S ribosomal protein L23, mitochondrial; Flags: Precursor [Schizosaccharomyces pombe 972h-]CAA90466.1 mitochondrial ribosomal protein subunit L23 (predicted) [Schizosaccharomyces pombe]|eukprot:NP_592920.1 putative mitochondrial ribosomal protein subunit L23 [Schizosaccharomyces pombe]